MLEYALSLGVNRVEIANTQYYGWGVFKSKISLPTKAVKWNDAKNPSMMWGCRGQMVIDYVVPDYYEQA